MGQKINGCQMVRRFGGEHSSGDACLAGDEGHEGSHVFPKRHCLVRWQDGTGCGVPFGHSAPHRPLRPGEQHCETCKGLGHVAGSILTAAPGQPPPPQRCTDCAGWGIVSAEAQPS